jgi:acid phosphatase family membrane protein YuiD
MENNLVTFIQNKYIYVPFLLWFGIQTFKVIYDLVTTHKFNFKRIMGAGGMPSSHSAVVVGLATLIGKDVGVGSPLFAISVILAFVVMYDAAGIRRAAGKQAALLNKIIETPGLTGMQVSERLVEVLGHTPKQVIVGALIGLIAGLIL